MNKRLEDMTLEELWQLFPIILTEHKLEWKEIYLEEEALLQKALSGFNIVSINHIGSTAVDGIKAKPIIDILVNIAAEEDMAAVSPAVINAGYRLMSRQEGRMSFNKGYTEQGFSERVFHLHLRFEGDCDEIYFRDYLNAHPETAREYEALKISLCEKYRHNRDAYTEAKTEFVKKYTEMAKGQGLRLHNQHVALNKQRD